AEFTRVLMADLQRSGIFRVLDPAAYIEDPQKSGTIREDINFGSWAAIGALGLVRGSYRGTPGGMTIEVRFFDVAAGSSLGGNKLSGKTSSAGAMAHRTADEIMKFVTGKAGPFDSWISFVSNRDSRFREIYIYSFDGRVEALTAHRSITMAPAWSPDAESLLFTSFKDGHPALYSYDLASGSDRRLAYRHGVNVGGAWSPGGQSVLFSRAVDGNTDVYSLSLASRRVTRLTSHWGIDVDPAWSPDGKRIAFCSSRSGSPQIYVMSARGESPRRISFQGRYNCTPAWSSDGRSLAWTGRVDGRFQIFTKLLDGGSPRQLTFEGENEHPTWSPDSRFIAFSGRRGSKRSIYMVGVLTGIITQLTVGPGDDTSPNWSAGLH
ncbi:MAG: Tol-Pal system beta propeller repeat protein TolB, partial [Candidatus Binatia bacterium]